MHLYTFTFAIPTRCINNSKTMFMRKGIYLCLTLSLLIVLIQCKPSHSIKPFHFMGEESIITTYNSTKISLPLLVILPDPSNSLITPDLLNTLAKRYRLVSISFLSSDDLLRQRQIDNLTNRINLYSEYLNLLNITESDSLFILAEGLNGNIISQYNHAFRIKGELFLNPFTPTLHSIFTSNCYATQTSRCDSILGYFGFTNRTQLDSLLVAVKQQSTDNIYGTYTLSFWSEALHYNLKQPSNNIKRYTIYTNNSGLQPNQAMLPKNTSVIEKGKLPALLFSTMRTQF